MSFFHVYFISYTILFDYFTISGFLLLNLLNFVVKLLKDNDNLEKGKPVVKLGRKTMGLYKLDCQVTIHNCVLLKAQASDNISALGLFFEIMEKLWIMSKKLRLSHGGGIH